MDDPRSNVRDLVQEEIRRLVADAIAHGDIVNTGLLAAQIDRAYGDCGLTREEIMLEIAAACAKAGVPLELSTPPTSPGKPSSATQE